MSQGRIFVNLCKHEEDFGVCAEWSFFVPGVINLLVME